MNDVTKEKVGHICQNINKTDLTALKLVLQIEWWADMSVPVSMKIENSSEIEQHSLRHTGLKWT